jgi:hypothetical protein
MIWPAKITNFTISNSEGITMKFKRGDPVRFLNDTGGGIINRIDDNDHVYVLTDDGFEIPVSEKELIFSGNFTLTDWEEPEIKPVIEPDRKTGKQEHQKALRMQEIPGNIPVNAPAEFLLGFIPEISGPVFSSDLSCYLINDSAYAAYYHLGIREGGEFYYLSSGMIEAETKNHIKSFDQTAVSKISDIHVQLILVSKGKYKRKEAIDILIGLNLVNFSKESYYRENDYFEEKAVLFSINSGLSKVIPDDIVVPEEVRELKQQADVNPDKQSKKKEPAPDTLEVDLHMDELALQNTQFSPAGILALQMSRFHSAIEEAISKKLRKLVIIHGLGQGTLKMQIRKELQEKYPQYIYQDASFKEYGFGATLVHLIIEKKQ